MLEDNLMYCITFDFSSENGFILDNAITLLSGIGLTRMSCRQTLWTSWFTLQQSEVTHLELTLEQNGPKL